MPRFIIEKPVYFRMEVTASDIETARKQADGIVDAAGKLINFIVPDDDSEPDVYVCEDGEMVEVDDYGPLPDGKTGERCDP